MSCGVGCRRCSDPTLLWLWYRLAAAAPIRPLAWEPPCAAGASLEKAKRQKKKKKKKKKKKEFLEIGGFHVTYPSFISLQFCKYMVSRILFTLTNFYVLIFKMEKNHFFTLYDMLKIKKLCWLKCKGKIKSIMIIIYTK